MKKQKAFTLIELLVVIAVIGLLASIVMVSMRNSREDAELKRVMLFSSSIQHALGSSAIGTWSFEGSLKDTSGNNNNGIWLGSPGTFEKGIINKAVKPNNPILILPFQSNNFGLKSGAVTVEIWVNFNELPSPSGTGIFANLGMDLTLLHFLFYSANSNLDVNLNGDGWQSRFLLLNVLKPQKWYHIVYTNDGKGICKVFLNTMEFYPTSGVIGCGAITGIRETLYIYKINGLIDEARIYDSYITLSEVKKHYAEGLMKIGLAELYK